MCAKVKVNMELQLICLTQIVAYLLFYVIESACTIINQPCFAGKHCHTYPKI